MKKILLSVLFLIMLSPGVKVNFSIGIWAVILDSFDENFNEFDIDLGDDPVSTGLITWPIQQ